MYTCIIINRIQTYFFFLRLTQVETSRRLSLLPPLPSSMPLSSRRVIVSKHGALRMPSHAPRHKDRLKKQMRALILNKRSLGGGQSGEGSRSLHTVTNRDVAPRARNTPTADQTGGSGSTGEGRDAAALDAARAAPGAPARTHNGTEGSAAASALAVEEVRKITHAHGLKIDDLVDALVSQEKGGRSGGAVAEATPVSSEVLDGPSETAEVRGTSHSIRKHLERQERRARRFRRRRRTGRRRRRPRNHGGDPDTVSVTILSHKNRVRSHRKHSRIKRSIEKMGYAQLKAFLVQKGLVKPSSTAPESMLRQIAQGIFVN